MLVAHAAHDVLVAGPVAAALLVVALLTWRSSRGARRTGPAEMRGAGRGILAPMNERLRLTIAFEEPDEDGWMVARVVEVPGAISQGRTRDEARENVIDALRLMLSPPDAGETSGTYERVELQLQPIA